MGTKALVSAVILSMFIAGCASMKPTEFSSRPSAKGCNGSGNCFVDITLSTGSIVVDAEYVIINNPRRQDIKITWRVPEGNTLESIDFGDTGGQIDGCHSEGPRMISCIDHHMDLGVFKYTIKVTGFAPRDPWMVND